LNKRVLYAVIVIQTVILISAIMIGYSVGKTQPMGSRSNAYDFDILKNAMQLITDSYRDKEIVDQEKLMYGAVKGMVESLDDPYSQFLPSEMYKDMMDDTTGKFGGLGIEIGMTQLDGLDQLTVMSAFEGNPAFKAGILSGDLIVGIDGKPTSGINLYEAKRRLRGEPGTKVEIKIDREHEDEPLIFNIIRDIIQVSTVKYKILDGIGYIRLMQFSDTTTKDFDKALRTVEAEKVSGIILDLRSNPGGTLAAAVNVAGMFLKKDQLVVSTKGRTPEDSNEYNVSKGLYHTDLPLIVLIDKWSASGSEIVVGAIKDHKRGLIIGSGDKTFGKGSVQTIFPMIDGKSGMKLTVAYYYTPSGKNINKVGIEPDIKRPVLSTAELKMYQSLSSSKYLEEFVKASGDNILDELDKSNGNNGDKEKFRDLIKKMASENIKLDDSLVKLAIAQKTKNEIDEYKFDPIIKFAVERLKLGSAKL
jgi:carboxyl-terminal processing protease